MNVYYWLSLVQQDLVAHTGFRLIFFKKNLSALSFAELCSQFPPPHDTLINCIGTDATTVLFQV